MKNSNTSTYLSKSLFMTGLKCHKALYLEKNNSEPKEEVSAEAKRRFEFGHEVGKYARGLFPGGFEVAHTEPSYPEQIKMTRQKIETGTKVIYEAAFIYDEVFARADIIRKTSKGWEVYEVKSSAEFKDHYIDDSAVQYYILTKSGLPVSSAFVVYINNKYVRDGNIEPEKLFTVMDITDKVQEKQNAVRDEIKKQKEMLRGGNPAIDIGEHCDKPYECAFEAHCWKHIPKEYSVFDLAGKGANTYDLYRKGILKLADIPIGILNEKQRMQVEAFINKSEIVNNNGVKNFINSLWYPLYFLDFETFDTPIPPFNGTRPYQKIPFQYSLHYLEEKGGELKHKEFLALPNEDHREKLTGKLLGEIPANACVLAYHMTFEKGILNNLKEWFPKCAEKIDSINNGMLDLKTPFKNRYLYHWKMNGSASLKAVLPVVIPDMSYDGMEVSHGGEAQQAYFDMCEAKNSIELEKIRNALLEYCSQDTLAMVKILEKLGEIAKAS